MATHVEFQAEVARGGKWAKLALKGLSTILVLVNLIQLSTVKKKKAFQTNAIRIFGGLDPASCSLTGIISVLTLLWNKPSVSLDSHFT